MERYSFVDKEPYKKEKPCDSYWGNVCSGFGGSLICKDCGWDRMDHDISAW